MSDKSKSGVISSGSMAEKSKSGAMGNDLGVVTDEVKKSNNLDKQGRIYMAILPPKAIRLSEVIPPPPPGPPPGICLSTSKCTNVIELSCHNGKQTNLGVSPSGKMMFLEKSGKAFPLPMRRASSSMDAGVKIDLAIEQVIKLVSANMFMGKVPCFAVTFSQLPTFGKPGQILLCPDGSLTLRVVFLGVDHVIAEVMNDISFELKKISNLPGVKVCLSGTPGSRSRQYL